MEEDFKEIPRNVLETYRRYNFTHDDSEKFLEEKGENPSDYVSIFLSVAWKNKVKDDERLYETELKLASSAIKESCSVVSNIDYCGPCIVAKGLIKKIKEKL